MRTNFLKLFFLILIITCMLATTKQVACAAGPTCSVFPKHGVTSVYTAADVDQAHKMGFQYVMPYYAIIGPKPTDTSTAYGQALVRNNMKVIIDVTNYGPPNSPPWLYQCVNGRVAPNLPFLTQMINDNKDSPLTLGYWIKDDDYHVCTDNSMADAMKTVYQTIKKLDPNPNHFVIAGFGGAYSIKAHYQPGEADIIGYYPFQAWNWADYVCSGAGNYQQVMSCEVNQMKSIVKSRTPAGQTPPAWIDLYQAYYTSTIEPDYQLKSDVQTAIAGGVSSLMAFAWDRGSGVDHVIKYDSALQSQASMVNGLAQTIPGANLCSTTGGGGSGVGATYMTSYTAITDVGTIGQSGGGGTPPAKNLGAYADNFVKAIYASCDPKVNYPAPNYVVVDQSNQGCLNDVAKHSSLSSKDVADMVQRLKNNLKENYALQCAGFAQAVSSPFGYIGNAPSAFLPADYGHSINGYTWHPRSQGQPQIGDIAVWNSHIAVVVDVSKTSDFQVAEANGESPNDKPTWKPGTVGEEWYKNVASQYGLTLYGFLRKT